MVLSTKQQQIIDFIRRFLADKHYPPTIRDIVTGCGISSTSVVDYNLNILEGEGYIRRHPEVARGIELLPGSPALGQRLLVPIIGQIAAGEPIPVPTPDTWDVAASSETLEVTEDLTRGRGGVYALRVKGSSMIDALINDGDIVLMQYGNVVENGEMAAIWLKAEKVAVPRGRPRKEVPTREWLKHQCAVLHKSLEEIGLERGVSRETVRSWLLEAKIPLTLRRHRRHGSL